MKRVRRKEDNTDYVGFLRSLLDRDVCFITFKEFVLTGKQNGKNVILRHDIDFDMKTAIEIAKAENKAGFRSTFFLLPPGSQGSSYFDYSEKFIDKCKKIRDLGHDLGLHNNAFATYLSTNQSIKEILKKPLDFLRGQGIEICGTSSHGEPSCYNEKYYNYEIWKEFDPSKNEQLNRRKIDAVSLNDFGLLYEANFLDYDFYLSDSGGKWRGIVINKDIPKYFEGSLARSKDNIGIKVVDEFKKAKKGVFQILTHPCWWHTAHWWNMACWRRTLRERK